jgi:hypothetical protein
LLLIILIAAAVIVLFGALMAVCEARRYMEDEWKRD